MVDVLSILKSNLCEEQLILVNDVLSILIIPSLVSKIVGLIWLIINGDKFDLRLLLKKGDFKIFYDVNLTWGSYVKRERISILRSSSKYWGKLIFSLLLTK